MLFDPSATDHLRPWLTRTLEPICDADPNALANYILALLKHNAPEPELRTEITSQLEEFLENETPNFVNTLFTALRTRSYLPYTTSSTPPPPPPPSEAPVPIPSVADNGIPIPLDAVLRPPDIRGRKRQVDYDTQDGRPAKGPRLSRDEQFSRYGGHLPGVSWHPNAYGASMMHMGNATGFIPPMGNGYQPPVSVGHRNICRDYHNTGYCARGAYCKFSHGEDAFVPMYPVMPMFNDMGFGVGGTSDTGYDPNDSRMELHPKSMAMNTRPPRPPLLPRGDDHTNSHPTGELPVIQDLTPRDAQIETTAIEENISTDLNGASESNAVATLSVFDPGMSLRHDANGSINLPLMRGVQRGFRGGPARGRNVTGLRPGTFGGDAQHFRHDQKKDKTLVVEKIPEDNLSLDAVNNWFKRFGTVTNVAIDVTASKALVSFSEHEQARSAWRSEEAVFGNRFVKVFWHRPMEGHGHTGQRMLDASAPIVAHMSAKTNSSPSRTSGPASTVPADTVHAQQRPQSSPLVAKQQILEKHIAEQKELMERLKTASPEEKKEIFAQLRELGKEIEQKKSDGSLTVGSERQSTSSTGKAESTEALQAKLAKLKAEAASLGIETEASYSSYTTKPYHPYRGRGRGRGRGGFRGAMRTGPPANMRLDNRPKSLIVKDVAPENEQSVRDWFETTGQLESFDLLDNGDAIVSFRTRAAAEHAIAKGSDIPLVGTREISWHTNTPPTPRNSSTTDIKQGEIADESRSIDEEQKRHLGEDEDSPSGWGDSMEDGMGML